MAANSTVTVTRHPDYCDRHQHGLAHRHCRRFELPAGGVPVEFSGSNCDTEDADTDADESCELAFGLWSLTARHTDGSKPATTSNSLAVVIDNAADPTVTISVDDVYPVVNRAVTVTFEVSEDVTGFELADVSASGTLTAVNFPAAATPARTFTATFIPTDTAAPFEISVPAGAFADAAGNLKRGHCRPRDLADGLCRCHPHAQHHLPCS